MAEQREPDGAVRAAVARWWRLVVVVVAALVIYGGGFWTGWIFAGQNGQRLPATAQGVAPLLWQAWNLAESHYVDQAALQPKDMIYGAIQGMLSALGDTDHTRFETPAEVQQENSQLSGHFVGIGVQIDLKDGRPVVVAPLPNSPAERAGLKPGDVILKVDGTDTAQLDLSKLSSQIRGPAGSKVELLILRPSTNQTFSVTITRADIVAPAVEYHQFVANGKRLEHIHVIQFSANADAQLRTALQAASKAHTDALILDLRENPGGLLDQAVAVSSEFLTGGNVLLVESRNGDRKPVPVKSGGEATSIPMVVLIDQGTASAAEITAGAIKDHQRGPLVGTTTFGTGTVLSTYSLSDGSQVLLGTEEWLTPNGNLIWHHGITPTQTVTLPANAHPLFPSTEAHQTDAQILQTDDAQLQQAITDLGG